MRKAKQFDSLSTSFVSLPALIRQLRNERFVGSIHVTLEHYEAEVVFDGQGAETVTEIDQATGRASQTEGAMERLLVHASEPRGTIVVYESNAATDSPDEISAAVETPVSISQATTAGGFDFQARSETLTEEDVDWNDLLDAGGALTGAVERAVKSLDQDFDSNFRAACISLGDDYPFLDPTANGLAYANRIITLSDTPGSNAFVTGLSECLRRVVNKLAMDKDRKRFRETVAVELAVAVRMRPNGPAQFKPYLDQIAGTRVL